MPAKSDHWIIEQSQKNAMIQPFAAAQVKEVEKANGDSQRVISFGVSSYGYDMRIGNVFRVFNAKPGLELDPKNVDPALYQTVTVDDYLVLPPHGMALAQTVEYFRIPRDIITICFGKSTYARCGVLVNVTPFEPEWEGHATISITNASPCPARLYANEGIAQLLFLQSDEMCAVSYRDKNGKYQAQREITTAKV